MGNVIISKGDKDAFCEAFMRAREDGMTIRASYQQARTEMAAAGKRSPGFSTLEFWLRHGRQKAEEASASAAPENPDVEASADADPQERLSVYQDLLRAYRLRRECDIDRLLDRLAPEL